jgi:transcriptional regulator with XRE-family HTH domain
MTAVSYGDVLARNLRAARSRLGINQEVLAYRMRALGYSAWLRQTVANVEKGRRRVMAEEIFGLAYALETSISALMRATDDDGLVSFPSGDAIAAASVQRSAAGRNDGSVVFEFAYVRFPEPVLQQLAAEGVVSMRRVSSSTGDVTHLDRATGEWATQDPWAAAGAEPDDEEPSPGAASGRRRSAATARTRRPAASWDGSARSSPAAITARSGTAPASPPAAVSASYAGSGSPPRAKQTRRPGKCGS